MSHYLSQTPHSEIVCVVFFVKSSLIYCDYLKFDEHEQFR